MLHMLQFAETFI